MTAPKRIRLRRTKGWRKPDGAIVVARPSKWSNPFVVGETFGVSGPSPEGWMDCFSVTLTAENAAELFAQLWETRLVRMADNPEDQALEDQWRRDLEELRGHDLACWCRLDAPCHADVLLKILADLPERWI